MLVSILKKIGLAIVLIGVILFLANIFRPENASRIGSGFTRIIPAVAYPFKMALFSAMIFLVSSFIFKPKVWKVVYFVLFAINLVYLGYCIRVYVSA